MRTGSTKNLVPTHEEKIIVPHSTNPNHTKPQPILTNHTPMRMTITTIRIMGKNRTSTMMRTTMGSSIKHQAIVLHSRMRPKTAMKSRHTDTAERGWAIKKRGAARTPLIRRIIKTKKYYHLKWL